MTLLTLFNELFLEIVSYLEYDSEINALMQISGRLYDLLIPYLYRYNARYFEGFALVLLYGSLEQCPASRTRGHRGRRSAVASKTQRPDTFEEAVSFGYNSAVKTILDSESGMAEPEKWIKPILGIKDQDNKERKCLYQLDRNVPLFLALHNGHSAVTQIMIDHLKMLQKGG